MTNVAPTVGEVVADRTVHLTRESLVRYAGASGDFNPIHYSDEVAERVGLPGVLAHGMLTMGLAGSTIVPWLGDAGRITDYGVRFTRPVVVDANDGADVRVVATVAEVDEEAGTARIDLVVSHAETTVLGKAQVRVRLA
jgi:acyl dehydratase